MFVGPGRQPLLKRRTRLSTSQWLLRLLRRRGLHELSDVGKALHPSLEQSDAAVHVGTEIVRHPREIDAVPPAPLAQQRYEQRIVLPEQRVSVELAILLGELLGIRN